MPQQHLNHWSSFGLNLFDSSFTEKFWIWTNNNDNLAEIFLIWIEVSRPRSCNLEFKSKLWIVSVEDLHNNFSPSESRIIQLTDRHVKCVKLLWLSTGWYKEDFSWVAKQEEEVEGNHLVDTYLHKSLIMLCLLCLSLISNTKLYQTLLATPTPELHQNMPEKF